MISTVFHGGPFDGQTRLGRQRPTMPADSMAGDPSDAGVDSMRIDAAGGEYRRESADGEAEDRYVWHADNERRGAA